MSDFSTLYPVSEGSCNGLTIEGVECARSDDGGFLVPAKHVADVLAFIPGMTSEKPEAPQADGDDAPKKRGRPAKVVEDAASEAPQAEA